MRTDHDIATCIYYTGIDPFTRQPVQVARGMRDRKTQRAQMQFFKPDNDFAVREALLEAGRADLIGGCEGLIPANPPREAIEARRRQANPAGGEEPGERGAGPPRPTGDRPGRKYQKRRPGKNGH
jgi:hypothetical protein